MSRMVRALSELMAVGSATSIGNVIEFDLNTVTVDLSPFPIDEILDFRAQYLKEVQAVHAFRSKVCNGAFPHACCGAKNRLRTEAD